MIKFNELRITPNNENLIIDVSIEDAEYFKDVFLDSIIIDTQDTYTIDGPSSKAVFTYTVSEEDFDSVYSLPENYSHAPTQDEEDNNYCFTIDNYSRKSVRLILNAKDLGVSIANNMFFIYALTSGEPTSDTPRELLETKIVGTAVNTYTIYKQSIAYVKELGDTCEIPKNFIDFIFRIKALDLAIKTGNYQEAIKYWNKFFKVMSYNVESSSSCGCYGSSI